MTNATTDLPGRQDAGCAGSWDITDWSGRVRKVTGRFLGAGSTYRAFHKGHPAGSPAMRGQHCSACRWSEISLFREDGSDGMYIIVNRGISVVPDETERTSMTDVTPEALEEWMVILRDLGHGGMLFTSSAMSMLAQAAENDEYLARAASERRV